MDRKAIAQETLDIMKKGCYQINNEQINIQKLQEKSIIESFLLTPEQGELLLEEMLSLEKKPSNSTSSLSHPKWKVWNCSAVDAILKLTAEEKQLCAVLNFASAKNPGGGFINGAMAQEESLAASSCLYKTLTIHEEYYQKNRQCKSMMYTDHAIYSPEVVFFRNGNFQLIRQPVTASVLTLPAVNMGQVIQKGENIQLAQQIMKRRMKLALAIFAKQNCKNLILGAYGCGVFRNDPKNIAAWWHDLLTNLYPHTFETIVFAVLDRSASQNCIRAFTDVFGN